TYTRGTTIHLRFTYRANDLDMEHPATIQYEVVYNGNTYDSPVLPFGEQNESECVHGLWGMLNEGRAGGYFQPRANTGASLKATWSNIVFNPAEISVRPRVLNKNSSGRYVTGNIEIVDDGARGETGINRISANDIDVSSIRLNGSVSVAPGAPVTLGDSDGDGIPDLTVKFDRLSVIAALTTPCGPAAVTPERQGGLSAPDGQGHAPRDNPLFVYS